MIQYIVGISAVSAISGYLLFLIVKQERTVASYSLIAVLLMTASVHSFDLLAMNYPDRFVFFKKLSLVCESTLPFAWLLSSLASHRKEDSTSISILQKILLLISPVFLAAAVMMPVDKFYYAPDFDVEKVLFLGNYGFAFYAGLLVYLIISLVNLEMTLLTAPRTIRWRIKFDIIGTGAVAAVFVFYYSQGLLYRTINMDLLPVRSLVLIIAVMLMAYSRIRRGNGVKLHVSKQMAYKSVVILAVGLYLIVFGLIAEAMRYYGKEAQNIVLVSLAFISAIGLLIVLLSENVKRKMKVFLYKNFYTNKYDYRSQWLQFTEKISLSKTETELLDGILVAFCETFGMGGAGLYIYNPERNSYYAAALHEMEDRESIFLEENPLILYMENEKKIFHNKDDGLEVVAANKEIFERLGVVFVVPMYSDDKIAGFITLARPVNSNEIYIYEDYDLMKTLACQAYSVILNLRLSDELLRAREMEMIGKMSSFMMHDLKNLLSTLCLIVENSADHIDDPDFQSDMLQSLKMTVEKMKDMVARLKNLKEKESLNFQVSDLHDIASKIISMVNYGEISLHGSTVYSAVDAEEIQKVILNLVLNAVEATESGGRVKVETGADTMAFIRVIDNGCGISKEFLQKHLFMPFRTTKKKGFGIGLYQCRQVVEAHHGRIDVQSEPGNGSVFTVFLPLLAKPEYAVEEAQG